MMKGNESEVARLRQRIEDEIASMNLLMHGPAIVGRHDIITRKYNNLAAYRRNLEELIGDEQAGPLFFTIYFHLTEGDQDAIG